MASHEEEAYLLVTAEEVGSALDCSLPHKIGDFVGENGYSSAPKDTETLNLKNIGNIITQLRCS